jgi:hypothetical protein
LSYLTTIDTLITAETQKHEAPTKLYNLDAINAVGYGISSPRSVKFPLSLPCSEEQTG